MTPTIPRCDDCGRQRNLTDTFDYHPLQVFGGKPFGWYSGDDGEMCPQCMEKVMRP